MTGMTGIFRALTVAVFAAAILGGCAETSLPEATGKGTINMINAMVASPSVGFLIEERALGAVAYKGAHGAQSFDDLTYNFNFEYFVLGDTTPIRTATVLLDVVADNEYTFVLTGSVTAPDLTLWERPQRDWDDTETVFEAAIAHLSPALGDIDVYFATTGTTPVLGEERAKLSFGERLPEIDLENGEYEFIITARDDPATILYQSGPVTYSARVSYVQAIFDADASITGNIAVRSISSLGISSELPDANSLPTVRTVHAAFGTVNLDIYADEDFTAPIFSDLGFGESTGDLPVDEGTLLYTYTAVGNPGVIIDEESQLVPRGRRISTVLAGLPGTDLSRIILTDDRRSIETHANLRLIQAAANFEALDLYFVDAGTDITDINPTFPGMPFGFASDFVAQMAGSYDFILTLPDEKDPIATPLQLDLVEGDVVEALMIDTVDPTIVEVAITSF
ncbi:MAG: DUF4397 domain-containing protein [Gammaproteobacteria bacterium]|nr:DUF4397 domain-containing protein [Gammaproteobacteria bacterium]